METKFQNGLEAYFKELTAINEALTGIQKKYEQEHLEKVTSSFEQLANPGKILEYTEKVKALKSRISHVSLRTAELKRRAKKIQKAHLSHYTPPATTSPVQQETAKIVKLEPTDIVKIKLNNYASKNTENLVTTNTKARRIDQISQNSNPQTVNPTDKKPESIPTVTKIKVSSRRRRNTPKIN